jgi:hypothetical protein
MSFPEFETMRPRIVPAFAHVASMTFDEWLHPHDIPPDLGDNPLIGAMPVPAASACFAAATRIAATANAAGV